MAECSPSSAALLSRLFFFVMTSKTFYFHNCIHLVWMILDDCWAPSGIMLRHFMRLFRNVQIVQIIPERFETGLFTFFYSWLFWYRQFCPLCVIILWHKFVTSRGWSNRPQWLSEPRAERFSFLVVAPLPVDDGVAASTCNGKAGARSASHLNLDQSSPSSSLHHRPQIRN